MSRAKVEQELLEVQFPYLTADIRRRISATAQANDCSDVDDVVIDEVWARYGEELSDLLDVTSGSKQLDVAKREELRTYLDQGLEYDATLRGLPDDDLESLLKQTHDRDQLDRVAKQHRLGEQRDRWDFFNRPEANADMEYWQKANAFSPDEAVALTFGKLHRIVNEESLKRTKTVGFSPFRSEYIKRLDLVRRAIAVNELSDPIEREKFLGWTRRYNIPNALDALPAKPESYWEQRCRELEKRCTELQAELDDSSPFENRPKMTTKTTVFKIILGVAVEQFKHQIGGHQSNAVAQIETMLKDAEQNDRRDGGVGSFVAFRLSDDKIRQAIKEAEQFLLDKVST